MPTIKLEPGGHKEWTSPAGSVIVRDHDGYPSYDPDTLEPATDEHRWSAGPWKSNPREMAWKKKRTTVASVQVVVGEQPPPKKTSVPSIFAPHPKWNPLTVAAEPRLAQGGVETRPEPRVALPSSAAIDHVPGAWEVEWEWDRLNEPANRRYRADSVQVFARPTRERGSGSTWASTLREHGPNGNGQPWGPFRLPYPRAVKETRRDGTQVMEPFPPRTLFDLRLVVHGARFPLDIGVSEVIGQAVTTPTGKAPRGISMEVWQGRRLPTLEPTDADELSRLRMLTEAATQSLAVRAATLGRPVPAETLQQALQAAGCRLTLYTLDQQCWAVTDEILDEWLSTDDTDAEAYVAEAWDCDNFATALCARASSTLGNCCGVVVDFSGRHAYNAFAVVRMHGQIAVRFVEPQNDSTVDLGDRIGEAEAYIGEAGYIHWP